MKSKLLTVLLLVCALAATHRTLAQGFIGNGVTGGDGIKAVNSSGTLTGVNVGIGLAAASSATLEVADPSGGLLGLKFDNLPNNTTSYVLYYDGTGTVTYGPVSAGGIDSADFNCGIGTLSIYTPSGTLNTLSRTWLLSGSTTVDTGNYLGTYNNDDIRIATNNGNCILNPLEKKMIIGSDANNGNVEIGWDGANALPTPTASNFNKFLVQNGTVSQNPLNTFLSSGINPSDVAIAAYANETIDPFNVGILSLSDNTSATNNIGIASVAVNGLNNNGFIGQVSSTGVGVNSNIAYQAKVSGDNAIINQGYQGYVSGDNVSASGGQGNFGLRLNTNGTGSQNVGCWANTFSSTGNTTDIDLGIAGYISNAVDIAPTTFVAGSRIGVYGGIDESSDALYNYGVEGDLSGLTSITSGVPYYAVYGYAAIGGSGSGTSSTLVSTSATNASYAGFFEGDVFCSNTYYYSDPKLKENIAVYSGALDKLKELPVKSYTFRQTEFPTMNFPQGPQVGILSTDMKAAFPNLVKPAIHPANKKDKQSVTYDAVNYNALIPVLVEAVQELNAKTDSVTTNTILTNTIAAQQAQLTQQAQQLADQGKQISDLHDMLNDLCTNGCSGFKLNNNNQSTQGAILYQSVPNPTSGSAVIGYSINMPFSVASVQIVDGGGKLVRQYTLPQQQGAGSVTFDGSSVAAATYSYSLIIDGKVYDTKSIVKIKE